MRDAGQEDLFHSAETGGGGDDGQRDSQGQGDVEMKQWLWNYVPEWLHWIVMRLTGWRIVRVSGDNMLSARYYWSRHYPEWGD